MSTNAVTPSIQGISGYSGASGTVVGSTSMLNIIFDGASSVITSGTNAWAEIPWAANVLQWDLTGNVSGTMTCDVRRSTYVNFSGTPFLSGLSIVDGTKPTITSAFKGQSTNPGWSGLAAGDFLNFVIDSTPASITKATLSVKVQRTA
jgi:hypothetical protein